MNKIKEILAHWYNNFNFREEFKKDPLTACKNAGFEVTPELLAKIEATLKLRDGKSDNEQLDDRISK